MSQAQLAEAEIAQLREQVVKQEDELHMLSLKVEEQGRQLAAAHSSQQVQLKELGDKYGAGAHVSISDLNTPRVPVYTCMLD